MGRRSRKNKGKSQKFSISKVAVNKPVTSDESKPSNAFRCEFGEPEAVLKSQLNDYVGSQLVHNGSYYEPPVSLQGLARLLMANAYHGPILEFKTMQVMLGFNPSPMLSRRHMYAAVTDFNVFKNCYFQRFRNGMGEATRLRHLPAINMRRLKEPGRYGLLTQTGNLIRFKLGEVVHIKNYDVKQNIYGVPSYLGAIQSMLLNEDATLFRRRYYLNGAHMGYIFYSSSSGLGEEDQEAIKDKIRSSKGIGNFKNMFLHIPGGREKDIQILPVGDFSTKDELEKIKNISRGDIIAAHRMHPAMANVLPEGNVNFGDISKVDPVWRKNEVLPIQEQMLDINEWLPERGWISFEPIGDQAAAEAGRPGG
ncbi:phage portal protein [Endozoicomonas lisbonensis]|uniref:PBSX family phage portal protein n=1 Tax=Endozoicomonas lisbonensis TaxID=3120522 RepID=A0ABV2SGX6_9GAMM